VPARDAFRAATLLADGLAFAFLVALAGLFLLPKRLVEILDKNPLLLLLFAEALAAGALAAGAFVFTVPLLADISN
jgi:hypothetical protein